MAFFRVFITIYAQLCNINYFGANKLISLKHKFLFRCFSCLVFNTRSIIKMVLYTT